MRLGRCASVLLPVLWLAGCFSQQASEAPPDVRRELAGIWRQTDGPASFRFYEDGTVLVNLPARKPPLRFLSSYESLKKGGIGIATGEVWLGPITCDWKPGRKTMIVTLPEKEPVTLRLVREEGREERRPPAR